MKTKEFNKFYERYLNGEFVCTHRHKNLMNVDVVKAAKELCAFEVSYTDLDFKFDKINEIGEQMVEFMEYIEELEQKDSYKALIHLAYYFQEKDIRYKNAKIKFNKQYFEEPGMNFIDTIISKREVLDEIESTKNFFTDLGKVIGKALKEQEDIENKTNKNNKL